MRTQRWVFLAGMMIATAASVASAAVAPTTVALVVSDMYEREPLRGAAGGDVNADGATNAADLPAVLSGMRNPSWSGPYRVGVVEQEFVKNSETTGDPRPLNTVIWYPTDSQEPIDPELHGVVGAPLAAGVGALPLLVHSHGSCGNPLRMACFTTRMASHGFIVAAPPHPGNLASDPGCGGGPAQADSFLNRSADIMFVIDSMLALNTDSSSMFFGAIDAARIGMSGHSFGGQTTFRVAATDTRVIAALPFAPFSLAIDNELDQLTANPKPIQIQGAENDTAVPFQQHQQAPFDRLSPPKSLLKVLYVPGGYAHHIIWEGPCDDELPPTRELRLILRYAVPFLLAGVAGDDRFAAFLQPAALPAGVEYTAE